MTYGIFLCLENNHQLIIPFLCLFTLTWKRGCILKATFLGHFSIKNNIFRANVVFVEIKIKINRAPNFRQDIFSQLTKINDDKKDPKLSTKFYIVSYKHEQIQSCGSE